MDSNPYVPPLARVEDPAPATHEVPRSVARAVWVLRLLLAAAMPVAMVLGYRTSVSPRFVGFLLVGVGNALLFLLLSLPVSSGRNWARVVVLVYSPVFLLYAVVCLALIVLVFVSPKGGELAWKSAVVLAVVGTLTFLQGAGVVLANCFLWGKTSRRWFLQKRRR